MIGTDRKQSKKLMMLGIPKQTADMHISWHWDSIVESTKVWELNTGFPIRDSHIPAWSLDALIELFPCSKDDDTPIFELTRGGWTPSWTRNWFARFGGYECDAKTPLDAVVSLIVMLYDNGIKLW